LLYGLAFVIEGVASWIRGVRAILPAIASGIIGTLQPACWNQCH
jgi:hypothetical protein